MFANRDPQSGNHRLARINRHVADAMIRLGRFIRVVVRSPFLIEVSLFGLHNSHRHGQEIDAAFDIFLKGGREWNRHTIKFVFEHALAYLQRRVCASVNNRNDRNPGTDFQQAVHCHVDLEFEFVVVFVMVPVGMERVIGVEEKVAQPQRDSVAAKGLSRAIGEGFQVQCLFAEALL